MGELGLVDIDMIVFVLNDWLRSWKDWPCYGKD